MRSVSRKDIKARGIFILLIMVVLISWKLFSTNNWWELIPFLILTFIPFGLFWRYVLKVSLRKGTLDNIPTYVGLAFAVLFAILEAVNPDPFLDAIDQANLIAIFWCWGMFCLKYSDPSGTAEQTPT